MQPGEFLSNEKATKSGHWRWPHGRFGRLGWWQCTLLFLWGCRFFRWLEVTVSSFHLAITLHCYQIIEGCTITYCHFTCWVTFLNVFPASVHFINRFSSHLHSAGYLLTLAGCCTVILNLIIKFLTEFLCSYLTVFI